MITFVHNSSALLAIFQSIASIRLCRAWCSGSSASCPKRRMCHSSRFNRSAGSSCSSFCASVVFPEQGSPTIKWRVAILLTPKGHLEAAQRLALLAGGRAWTLLGSRENSKPEKYLKMPQNPQHTLLGVVRLNKTYC